MNPSKSGLARFHWVPRFPHQHVGVRGVGMSHGTAPLGAGLVHLAVGAGVGSGLRAGVVPKRTSVGSGALNTKMGQIGSTTYIALYNQQTDGWIIREQSAIPQLHSHDSTTTLPRFHNQNLRIPQPNSHDSTTKISGFHNQTSHDSTTKTSGFHNQNLAILQLTTIDSTRKNCRYLLSL